MRYRVLVVLELVARAFEERLGRPAAFDCHDVVNGAVRHEEALLALGRQALLDRLLVAEETAEHGQTGERLGPRQAETQRQAATLREPTQHRIARRCAG